MPARRSSNAAAIFLVPVACSQAAPVSSSTGAPRRFHCSSRLRRSASPRALCAMCRVPSRRSWQSMLYLSIRLNTKAGAAPSIRLSWLPTASPNPASISSGGIHMPAFTRPTLRPEPPWPQRWASSTQTLLPCSSKCTAADKPVKPAPMTQTSAVTSPLSAARSGRCGVSFSHKHSSRNGIARLQQKPNQHTVHL
ncbi:hypothetical protein D3C80_1357220 [compost metagenome]